MTKMRTVGLAARRSMMMFTKVVQWSGVERLIQDGSRENERAREKNKQLETAGLHKLCCKRSRIRELQQQLERQSSKESFLLLFKINMIWQIRKTNHQKEKNYGNDVLTWVRKDRTKAPAELLTPERSANSYSFFFFFSRRKGSVHGQRGRWVGRNLGKFFLQFLFSQ